MAMGKPFKLNPYRPGADPAELEAHLESLKASPVSPEYKAALDDTAEHLDQIEEAESLVAACRHVLQSGKRCKAIAMHGKHFCFYHDENRGKYYTGGYEKEPFLGYRMMEDRSSIQSMLNQVMTAYTNRFIDDKTARMYLYGIQLSIANLGRAGELVLKDAESDIEYHGGGPMVPPRDGESAPPPPKYVIWNRQRTAPLIPPED